uniref:ribosomal protein L32 n=1 Tax=Jasminum dichotomum TaxID=693376 RepID=UPI002E78699A|nr:ribosomal protein L32 [Jasminum dichotomum]YP_011001526.1 ribosomal protein L32 [Jasminum multiflorum]WPN86534.1 ribosomal protein L32 [Jasminum dichotomum]WPN86798.1 ribosomal protein L32 [Jasminum multiflorum]WQA11087.1 ribosomal protein L32 [Jasminum multiflorum]
MAVPKKRISASKKRIRKNSWKAKGYGTALKAFSLGKSLSTGNSKSFFVPKNSLKVLKRIIKFLNNLNRLESKN